MTGMTKDYAIAILRRMQEPEPFEPQINESAFDALEMAIEAIQKYSTWSQTYSNMVEDVISRKAAIDAIHKYFGKRIEQSPMHKTVDGEVYDLGICNPLLADNKALSRAIKELPPAQPLLNQGQPRIQSSDCISRQAVIDAIVTWTVEDRPDVEMPTDLIDRIRNLTSAQPELAQDLPNACTDAISRQVAIDAVLDLNAEHRVSWKDAVIDLIDDLPSAQPEPDTALYVEGFNDGYKQGKKDAQPDIAKDIATIIENEKDMRAILQPEIIRCKDCKKNPHWEWVGCPMTGKNTRKPDDFCSYAERRTDEDK